LDHLVAGADAVMVRVEKGDYPLALIRLQRVPENGSGRPNRHVQREHPDHDVAPRAGGAECERNRPEEEEPDPEIERGEDRAQERRGEDEDHPDGKPGPKKHRHHRGGNAQRGAEVGFDQDEHEDPARHGHHREDMAPAADVEARPRQHAGDEEERGDLGQFRGLELEAADAQPALGPQALDAEQRHRQKQYHGDCIEEVAVFFPQSERERGGEQENHQPQSEPAQLTGEEAAPSGDRGHVAGRIDQQQPDAQKCEHRQHQKPVEIA
jgi:hypothetical protein